MSKYDDPQYAVAQTVQLGHNTLSSGTGVLAAFADFAAGKITAAKAIVLTAGGSSNSGYKIYKGTTSIGTIAAGTGAAASVIVGTVTETTYAATDYLKIGRSCTGDTLKADVYIQIQTTYAS